MRIANSFNGSFGQDERTGFRPVLKFLSGGLFFPLILLAMLLSTQVGIARAESQKAQEYQIKAVFILNMINYIDINGGSPSNDSNTIIIGILGNDPFGNALDTLKGRAVRGKKIVIRRYDQVEEARESQILFISASEKRNLVHVLRVIKNSPILSIGDQEGFCQAGGIINMVRINNRIGFEANVAVAKRAGIQISSQMLRLAKDVIN